MPDLWSFLGGQEGSWEVRGLSAYRGDPLAPARRLAVQAAEADEPAGTGWRLRAVTSNLRYTARDELAELQRRQEGLARPGSSRAALIPIRKSAAWWDLPQDERRAIFEETSHHTAIGLTYLPAVARRLHHCRDLGEPFDFLTWFEFAPGDEAAFDDLLAKLRATHEWTFVDREVDIRLERRS